MEYLLICKGQKKGVMADTNMTTALRQLKLEVDMDNYDEANVGTLDALMHNRTAVKTLTSAVFTHGMQSEVRFTCMPPPMNSSSIIASLEAEQRAHDDLAMLTGPTEINPSGRKYWLMLAWALRFRPKVDVILKQESDVIVDWRRAVPAMLQQVATAEGRFLVGRFCDPKLCMPMRRMGRCAGGMVNGMSAGFARWLTSSVELEGCDALAGCDATNSSSGARWRLRAGPQDGAPAGHAAAASPASPARAPVRAPARAAWRGARHPPPPPSSARGREGHRTTAAAAAAPAAAAAGAACWRASAAAPA